MTERRTMCPCLLLITCARVRTLSFQAIQSQCRIIDPTLILIKTLWFIHINTVFRLTFTVFVRIQNTFRKIKVV